MTCFMRVCLRAVVRVATFCLAVVALVVDVVCGLFVRC